MVLWWPALTVIGFLVVTAAIIVLGLRSTHRYEQQRAASSATAAPPPADRIHGDQATVPMQRPAPFPPHRTQRTAPPPVEVSGVRPDGAEPQTARRQDG
jgi:hypothetical protein